MSNFGEAWERFKAKPIAKAVGAVVVVILLYVLAGQFGWV